MNTSTFNTYNTNLRAVYFRDMRIYQTGCIPRYNVKKSEPTIICSLYLRNIHLSFDKRPPQKDRNTYKQKLYCLKISSSSNLNSLQFGLTHNNNIKLSFLQENFNVVQFAYKCTILHSLYQNGDNTDRKREWTTSLSYFIIFILT